MKQGIRLDKGQIEIIDNEMAEVLRRKTAAQRIGIGFGLWTSCRNMLLSHLRVSNPEWDEERLKREVAMRMSSGAV